MTIDVIENVADSAMARAVALAQNGAGHTRPNPPVGAVVVDMNGRIAGEGWHRRAGGDHAEVAALKDAGEKARGSFVFVTLEPCSKRGRVGACTSALIEAGVAGVRYAVMDPNPTNSGNAQKILQEAGIDCEVFHGSDKITAAAQELIRPFAKHVKTGMPFVTVKIAMSLDGKICDKDGNARWISSESAREYTSGTLRERVDAIMVGAETVRKDDPSLLSHGAPNDDLVRVVISRSGKLPEKARIFTDGAPNKTLVYPDPRTALAELGKQDIMHVLCEGGLKLAVSMAEEGLVDEWKAVVAPKVIGGRPITEATIIDRFELIRG